MKALTSTTVIHVANLDRSVHYYTRVLGFTTDFKYGDYIGLMYDDVTVHLSGPDNHGTKKAPGSAHFTILCDEVDAYYDKIVKKGALIAIPIEDRAYGMRDFAVDDEDGNTLVFGMGLEDHGGNGQ